MIFLGMTIGFTTINPPRTAINSQVPSGASGFCSANSSKARLSGTVFLSGLLATQNDDWTRKLGSTWKHADLSCKLCMGQTSRPLQIDREKGDWFGPCPSVGPGQHPGKVNALHQMCVRLCLRCKTDGMKDRVQFPDQAGIPRFDFQALSIRKRLPWGIWNVWPCKQPLQVTSFQE